MRPSPRALLLLSLLPALALGADWMREYDRGLQAVRQEDWAEAERRFASAIEEDPVPQERRRFQGVVYRPYLPHYYAGLAAFRRGDCETALRYWNHAPTAAVLDKSSLGEERAQYRQGVETCRQRIASSRPAASPAPAAPRSATAPGAVPAALRGAVEAWLAGEYRRLLGIDPGAGPDPRSRAQLYLFRAAAAFALAELEGPGGAARLDAVRQDIRAARAQQPELEPDPQFFPPRFRRLWQQSR